MLNQITGADDDKIIFKFIEAVQTVTKFLLFAGTKTGSMLKDVINKIKDIWRWRERIIFHVVQKNPLWTDGE